MNNRKIGSLFIGGLLFFCIFRTYAQSAVTVPKSFYITREIKPPVLTIDPNSFIFEEPSGNKAIDANEECKIRFDVQNNGPGDGLECIGKITAQGATKDISFGDIMLNTISPGESKSVEIPIKSGMDTEDGNVVFTIQLTEAQGFGTEPIRLTVNTRKFQSPRLEIVDYAIVGSSKNTTLKKGEVFSLRLLLQNTRIGKAEDVSVKVVLPTGVVLVDESLRTMRFPSLGAGEKQSLEYRLLAQNSYAATTIPIRVLVGEKYGKYADNKTITLSVNQPLTTTLVIDEISERRDPVSIGHLSSAVDKDIPASSVVNDKTFAVIIANEDYQNTSNVPYAINDGGVFRNYCEKTLGIPAKNIHYVANATLNNIQGEVNWLENVLQSYEGQAKAIFYYAGHGIPDEASKDSYLLPVDGIGSNVRTGYKLQNLYASLGSMPSKSVTVFLDACFSGANRDGEMINPNLRGVVIRANAAAPSGNMVVFSAAQGYETAMPYAEESHGMFTYYLLKKLQETSGDVTYQELGEYLRRNVQRNSSVLGKAQTPVITPSATVGDEWKNWKLK